MELKDEKMKNSIDKNEGILLIYKKIIITPKKITAN